MSNINNDLLTIIQSILQDYASSCNVEPFDGKVIITNEMSKTYQETRGDLVESGKSNMYDIQQYHGLTVQPSDIDGKFTILLNEDYILESKTKHNVDWIGTLVHEAVHVNDFKNYYKIVSPNSYDELYDYNLHRMFLYWTEFHARAIGHYFLRKYTLVDFRDSKYVNYILETELPYQMNYMVNEVSKTDNGDRQMYVIVHFLGRLATWRYLYPQIFDNAFINELTNNNPWMGELFYLFIKHPTLEKIYTHFDDMKTIIGKYVSFS